MIYEKRLTSAPGSLGLLLEPYIKLLPSVANLDIRSLLRTTPLYLGMASLLQPFQPHQDQHH